MVSIPTYLHKSKKNAVIAICVPVRDIVTASFSYSLAMLMKKCGETSKKVTLHMVMGSEISSQRQQLVEQALQTNATHILWLDSDMKFPSDIIDRLLSHDKDIIACNYSTRVAPHRPVAFTSMIDMDDRLLETRGISEVFAVGMGCMLVNIDVYKNMSKPYFSVSWNSDYTSLEGEDLFFCKKARTKEYKVWIDNESSQFISHVGTREYTLKGDCI
jgi:hypothetical protein